MKPPTEHPASVQLLAAGTWFDFLRTSLNQPHHHLLISVYMISPWWNTKHLTTSLLNLLCNAAHHTPTRRILMAEIQQPADLKTFNLRAAARLLEAGWKVRTRPANHEKIWILGDKLCVIGSHNLSYTSATADADASVLINSDAFNQEMTARYWSRWAKGRTLSLEAIAHYGKNRLDQLTPYTGTRIQTLGKNSPGRLDR